MIMKTIEMLEKQYPDAVIFLKHNNNVQLLVAVMLSAQCTDKIVNRVTAELFKKYKNAKDFACANAHILEKEIKSTGFYKNKAKNIIATCKVIEEKHGGKVPKTMGELTALQGVGRKTANIVLGNAYGIVEGIAVDTHVKRVAYRLGLTKNTNPDKIEKDLMAALPKTKWFKITYILIEHGRAVCKAALPKCSKCIVNKKCQKQGVNKML